MSTATQFEMVELLEQAGARPRGNRHDCPKCGGFRTVTHTDETFFCHKCGWRGNAATLAKELGVYKPLPRDEYLRQKRERERAHNSVVRLYQAVRARRMELLDSLHELARLEALVHDAGMDDETAWDSLATVYRERPEIEGELDYLESASAKELSQFLPGFLVCPKMQQKFRATMPQDAPAAQRPPQTASVFMLGFSPAREP
ncbi:MAG: hypothetical protein ACRD1O_00875 [Terriglobia bacterium]